MFFGGEGFVYVRQREWYLAFKKKKSKSKKQKSIAYSYAFGEETAGWKWL